MLTTTKKMTIDEFLEAAPALGRCELVKGEVRPMSPTNPWHGIVTVRFTLAVGNYVEQHDLGYALTGEPGFVTDPDPRQPTVLAPDVAFFRKGRLTDPQSKKFPTIPPDLCVEVLSPSDRAGEVQQKIQDWLAFGVPLVWQCDPYAKTVAAHRPGRKVHVYREHETLTGGDILPGFELSLRKLFAP